MRAITHSPELAMVELPSPSLKPGDVLIKVAYAGVNRPDLLQRKGLYPAPPDASPLMGLEVSGTVMAVGSGVDQWKVGDRVCALTPGGGYAEEVTAPAGHCMPIPQGISMLQAAALPETYLTVWANLIERAKLARNETALIHGGSSGIGVTAIQMAKAAGARVIVTVGSEDKAQACRALGADHVIHYKTQDFVAAVAELTAGRGVDVILDMVAGPYVAREIDCLAEDGRLVIIAVQGGVNAEVNAGKVLRRRLTVTGSTLRPRPVAFKAAIAASLHQRVWPLLASGAIRPVVFQVFPPAQADQAHALMESNQHIGKIVLDWRL
jgi:NADPH2:quinone reductase